MAFNKAQMAKLAILRKMSGGSPIQGQQIATPMAPGTGNVNIPATTVMKMPTIKAPIQHSIISPIPKINTPPKKFKIKF